MPASELWISKSTLILRDAVSQKDVSVWDRFCVSGVRSLNCFQQATTVCTNWACVDTTAGITGSACTGTEICNTVYAYGTPFQLTPPFFNTNTDFENLLNRSIVSMWFQTPKGKLRKTRNSEIGDMDYLPFPNELAPGWFWSNLTSSVIVVTDSAPLVGKAKLWFLMQQKLSKNSSS